MMREASREQHHTTGYYTLPGLVQGCQSKTVACTSSFAFSTIPYHFLLKTHHICIIADDFKSF